MIFLIIFLLLVLTLCSIFESSISSLNLIRIKKLMDKKDNKAKVLYNLCQNYSDVITTILAINCISSVAVSSITAYHFGKVYGAGAASIATIILTIIILIFTEIAPKILGREYSEDFALKLSGLLRVLVLIFTPINKVLSLFDRKFKNENKVTATKDELVEIVKTIEDEGVIEEKESIFIQNSVSLRKLKVQNVMIDKDEVSYLYDTDSSTKVKNCVFRDNHVRIPIITKDNKVAGILYEVDLLDELLNNGKVSIKRSMHNPVCVFKSTSLASCLELLNSTRSHMALVTDKDNNFLGIITMEDIIKQLMRS